MKKKILIFSTAYLPLIGGAEIAVKEITDRLPDHQFVLITARLKKELPPEEKIGNIAVYRIGKGDSLDKLRLIWQGPKKAIELGRFDLIWSIMASYAGLAALNYKKKFKQIPLLLTLQEGGNPNEIYSKMIFCWRSFKNLFKSADRIQAISNYLGRWAKKMGAKCPIDVVPNGVDIKKFFCSDETLRSKSRIEVLKNLKLNEPVKLIITTSRLEKKNGLNDLIKSMSFLPDNCHLIIIGSGSLENKLKRLATALIDRVHFLGKIDHKDIPKYLWTSDVFCRPSLSEGLGNSFLEAMAAGIPVVATPVGGIPDFLKDPSTSSGQVATGLFCKVHDPEDIASKIKLVLSDENQRNYITNNAKKLVESEYNWDIISQKMNQTFNQLLVPLEIQQSIK